MGLFGPGVSIALDLREMILGFYPLMLRKLENASMSDYSTPVFVSAPGESLHWLSGGYSFIYSVIVDILLAQSHILLAINSSYLPPCYTGAVLLKVKAPLPDIHISLNSINHGWRHVNYLTDITVCLSYLPTELLLKQCHIRNCNGLQHCYI